MNKKRKKITCLILFITLVLQISAINFTSSIYKSFSENQLAIEQSQIDVENAFIENTIRGQQKNTLSSLTQSWIKYLDSNSNNDLIKKDINNLPMYIRNTEYVGYDATSMYKEQIKDLHLYNIYEKETNALILEHSRPQWDSAKLEEILDILVTPIKKFGNNGGMIVYDSNSGEVFLDTTPINRQKNGTVSIFDDDKLIENKNPEATKDII